MSGPGIIEAEDVDRCQLCGKIDETRPYGPNGEEICYACGMKDEETTKKMFLKHVHGEGLPRSKVRGKARKGIRK